MNQTRGLRIFNTAALALVVIGALNWLSIGLFQYNLIAQMFGTYVVITRIAFTIIGLAGVYCLSLLSLVWLHTGHRVERRAEPVPATH